MLAIAQSNSNYHYLNWIPSEQGPLVTKYGYLYKELVNLDKEEEHYFEVIQNIFSNFDDADPICTFSLDRKKLLFSKFISKDINKEMINWHCEQSIDMQLRKIMDFYHYPMGEGSNIILNIGVPKRIRQSFLVNMRLLKSRLNGIGVGIFSAEIGARKWMKADENSSYLIWKIGKQKKDELLYIKKDELITYFSVQRKKNDCKILWEYGDMNSARLIADDLAKIQAGKLKKFNSTNIAYFYTSEGNLNDVKAIDQLKINNLKLLNPLNILKTISGEKIDKFGTLPLAETGISFRGIDV